MNDSFRLPFPARWRSHHASALLSHKTTVQSVREAAIASLFPCPFTLTLDAVWHGYFCRIQSIPRGHGHCRQERKGMVFNIATQAGVAGVTVAPP